MREQNIRGCTGKSVTDHHQHHLAASSCGELPQQEGMLSTDREVVHRQTGLTHLSWLAERPAVSHPCQAQGSGQRRRQTSYSEQTSDEVDHG